MLPVEQWHEPLIVVPAVNRQLLLLWIFEKNEDSQLQLLRLGYSVVKIPHVFQCCGLRSTQLYMTVPVGAVGMETDY